MKSLGKNSKEMIGDDMISSYKANTNFIKYLLKLITYNYVLMECE